MEFSSYLLVFLLMEGSLACSGKDVNQIVDVLMEVTGWKSLANQLEINSDTIETNCLRNSIDIASCYRRELVKTYCDSTALEIEEIVENIAQALGPSNRRQADNLRAKFPRDCDAGDCATCDRPEPPTTTTTQPSNDFSSVSSSSRSDIDYGLVSAVITIAVILAMIFVLLVYIIGRLTDSPVPTHNNPHNIQHQPASFSTPKNHSQLHQRLPSVTTDLIEPIFGSKVDGSSLILIKYRLCGQRMELRILKEIVPKWKQLATRLGFKDSEIQNIEMNSYFRPSDAADAMIKEWTRKDVRCTWRKLIQKMREVELNVPADNLITALRNIV